MPLSLGHTRVPQSGQRVIITIAFIPPGLQPVLVSHRHQPIARGLWCKKKRLRRLWYNIGQSLVADAVRQHRLSQECLLKSRQFSARPTGAAAVILPPSPLCLLWFRFPRNRGPPRHRRSSQSRAIRRRPTQGWRMRANLAQLAAAAKEGTPIASLSSSTLREAGDPFGATCWLVRGLFLELKTLLCVGSSPEVSARIGAGELDLPRSRQYTGQRQTGWP